MKSKIQAKDLRGNETGGNRAHVQEVAGGSLPVSSEAQHQSDREHHGDSQHPSRHCPRLTRCSPRSRNVQRLCRLPPRRRNRPWPKDNHPALPRRDQAAASRRGLRSRKRKLIGVVIGDKMDKTRVVVGRAPPGSRQVRQVHDQAGEVQGARRKERISRRRSRGDRESRPLSREKRWRVERLLDRPQEA